MIKKKRRIEKTKTKQGRLFYLVLIYKTIWLPSYCKSQFLELNDELGDYERWLKGFNLPQSIWKYNQIIGYIQIIIKGKDIIFDLWICKDKRYFYNTTKKNFIEPMPTNGLHFFTNTMTDREIKIEIERFLKIIEKDFIKKNMYLDKTIYNNLVHNINIKNML